MGTFFITKYRYLGTEGPNDAQAPPSRALGKLTPRFNRRHRVDRSLVGYLHGDTFTRERNGNSNPRRRRVINDVGAKFSHDHFDVANQGLRVLPVATKPCTNMLSSVTQCQVCRRNFFGEVRHGGPHTREY
mgnify:FL=1